VQVSPPRVVDARVRSHLNRKAAPGPRNWWLDFFVPWSRYEAARQASTSVPLRSAYYESASHLADWRKAEGSALDWFADPEELTLLSGQAITVGNHLGHVEQSEAWAETIRLVKRTATAKRMRVVAGESQAQAPSSLTLPSDRSEEHVRAPTPGPKEDSEHGRPAIASTGTTIAFVVAGISWSVSCLAFYAGWPVFAPLAGLLFGTAAVFKVLFDLNGLLRAQDQTELLPSNLLVAGFVASLLLAVEALVGLIVVIARR
jgi:hypothetical protein